ncbi:proline dehydrogenase family protein [Planomonospora parontospora]|uniref:proline dehydrogenase family protein n=1 Tax=Planomonospora parontospora TaxID=58119 RepID=UPI0016713CFC|nr:proline dehydrogenase family protein [Planomonospora parontospora]GGL54421.1 proline dehydrogenase [Planomonospora parontospora subsp. antibiotica]GII13765.1 proline dehydrogenase [Planomonospora parontospora subsp. antibiotica]
MLGSLLLAGSRVPAVRRAVSGVPLTRKVVDRFVAGETPQDAVEAVRRLTGAGLTVTIDHLGEETRDAGAAASTAQAYTVLLGALRELDLGDRAEVSVKLSAVGQALGADGDKIALENARRICEAAHAAGADVTLDMEDHTTVDSTLGVLRALRGDFPRTGVALQAYLFRSEADCRDLSHEGSRVRLVKGAYAEPASVAHRDKTEVDKAYVRCLRILMAGGGYPMVATHDDRLISITELLADRSGRSRGDYEYQMLYGIRTDKQQALAGAGHTVRVYIPYGDDWYGYFMRRLAERPANVAFFLRALGGK